jgi:putative transposase
MTTQLVKNYDLIVLEDLNIKNMTKSAKGDLETPGKQVAQKKR